MANNSYQLDNPSETLRLEQQAKSKTFSLEDEIQSLNITMNENDRIIDIGCGTGLLSRFLCQKYLEKNISCSISGIDISTNLLNDAERENKKLPSTSKIQLFQQSIVGEMNIGLFNKIFCRYILQHLPSIELRYHAIKNIIKLASESSEIFLIESFGAMSHFDTDNAWLMDQIKIIETKSTIDLNIGLKLRGMFIDIGIDPGQIDLKTLPLTLPTAEDRKAEALNWSQRLWHAMPLLQSILGAEDSKRFLVEFPQSIIDPRSLLLGQKVLIKIKL
ncbi:MAG: class I SAM-dependent methyltransferase [Bacteriovoracaceae bacterium]|nr:class I SAM-dependent methyltransferase [Bacteriovoracaceae bacterium]